MFNWFTTTVTAAASTSAARLIDRSTGGHSITSAKAFASCNRRERADLERLSAAFPVGAGTQLTIEGSGRREFGVLLDGTATVHVDGEVVGSLGPGDHFGDVSVLIAAHDPSARQRATIVTDGEAWVATMTQSALRTFLRRFPHRSDSLQAGGGHRPTGDERSPERTGVEVGGLGLPSTV